MNLLLNLLLSRCENCTTTTTC